MEQCRLSATTPGSSSEPSIEKRVPGGMMTSMPTTSSPRLAMTYLAPSALAPKPSAASTLSCASSRAYVSTFKACACSISPGAVAMRTVMPNGFGRTTRSMSASAERAKVRLPNCIRMTVRRF